jgi:hypothetical protein
MSKTKQSKRKHPNQKLIDCFDLQAERELAVATQFSKNRRLPKACDRCATAERGLRRLQNGMFDHQDIQEIISSTLREMGCPPNAKLRDAGESGVE